jgi:hypothetical protein
MMKEFVFQLLIRFSCGSRRVADLRVRVNLSNIVMLNQLTIFYVQNTFSSWQGPYFTVLIIHEKVEPETPVVRFHPVKRGQDLNLPLLGIFPPLHHLFLQK